MALLCRFTLPPGKLIAFDEILMQLLEDDAIADWELPMLALVTWLK